MSHPRRLEGKVALVTAATAGIGLAIAERIGLEGAKVFICSRKQKSVDETVQQLKTKNITAAGCACHVGSDEQLKQYVEKAVQTFGKIDIVVSNAAANPVAAPIVDTPADAILKIFDVNVKSAIILVKEALPHMSKGGAIVFISSMTAFNPPTPIGVYAVSKTALLGLTKGLAAELAPQGIRVNCVAPGIVPTKFASYLVQSPELAQQQADATLLKRLGRPEDMAAAVAFLVSEDASYVTGETLPVTGGMPSRL